jgi:thiamine phosphate synthase YjbQ (UPF0047 family)
MSTTPLELHLRLVPEARYDVIDVTRAVRHCHGDVLAEYPRALYCSYHTTGGYLEQSLATRLQHSRQRLDPFIRLFQRLFPPGADYHHDQLDLRTELGEEEKSREPKNGDSHLAFIGSGLRNCVTYVNRGDQPVHFIDLDGVGPEGCRERRTTVLAYRAEEVVGTLDVALPPSAREVDAINLRDPRWGLLGPVEELVRCEGIAKGRLDISLGGSERHAGLTVNEFETLLMQHDLMEVLHNPLRFAPRAGNLLRHPLAIPNRTLDYAKYDFVHIFNEAMSALGISKSALERLLVRSIAYPASRFLRLKRSVSFLLSGDCAGGPVVLGRYQSPILVQWNTAGRERRLRLSLVRFL